MSVRSARDKLEETQYFYERLQHPDVYDNLKYTNYTVSALMSAARSSRWHVCEEAKTNPKLKVWWDKQKIQHDPCVEYFDKQRGISVHEKTVRVPRRTQIATASSVMLSAELTLLVTRADGTTESITTPPTPPPEPPEIVPPSTRHTYMFNDYPGGERKMLDACGELIGHLEAFVKEAEQNT